MYDERSTKRPKLDLEAIDANEAIKFELQSDSEIHHFQPDMTHQLFGDDEVILGHDNPQAKITIDQKTFQYTVSFKSDKRRPNATKVSFPLHAFGLAEP